MLLSLLHTKFYIPSLRSQLVLRDHLIERLQNPGTRRLTLISAPAGFGKSTLLSAWIAQHQQPVAWLSLDDDDNDPTRFLTYVIAALQTRQPTLGETALALLVAPQTPPPKAILTLLLNDLAALPTSLALILDDYHAIVAPLLHEAMTFLIEHLPPTLHLVISSRIDPPLPLARWRARNHLAEVRAEDLRFRTDEAATFLNEVMGLQLTAADISALEIRTEGWIAGLQLAALSLQGREDPSAFIQTFSGSHRHVLGYLLEEVLNRQPIDVLGFLMQTSILERMCGDLCEAVTGQADAFAMLMRLEQANLFIVPLDDEGRWYRYHHLFSQVLYSRLQQTQASRVAELHRRASTWCEQQGLLNEAMHYALAMPELDLAMSLLERYALSLLMQSELMLLRKWVAQLPGELIQSRPRLALAQGWVMVMLGQVDAAATALNTPALQPADLPADLAGELALLRADVANIRREPVALTWAQQALELLPLHREELRVIAQNEIGLAYMRRGDLAAANQALLEVAARAEAGENRYVVVDALTALHLIQVRQGQLPQAVRTIEQALRKVTRWGSPTPPAAGMLYIGLGEILYEWNELEKASEALAQGLSLLQRTLEKMPLVQGYVARARVRQAHGDRSGALASLAQAEAWFADLQIMAPLALTRLYAQRARLWIRQGHLDSARRWASESNLPIDTELACEHWLTLVRLHLAQFRHTADNVLLSQASTALVSVRKRAEADNWPIYLLEERLLQGLLLHTQNKLPDAFAVLAEVLTHAEAGGYVRIFVDEGEPMRLLMLDFRFWFAKEILDEKQASILVYADKLLATFPHAYRAIDVPRPMVALSPPHPIISSLVDPLSSRELEVLQLMASSLSNGEVSTKLVVTVGTVKSHVNRIFSKLEVTSRTMAIVRARALGLLTD